MAVGDPSPPPIPAMSGTDRLKAASPLELLPRETEREGGLRRGDSLSLRSWLPASSMPLAPRRKDGWVVA